MICAAVISVAASAQSDVERKVAKLQQNEEWGSPAQTWINDLGPKQYPQLVPLIGKIERWHALHIVGLKLSNAGHELAIPELIKTFSRRYPPRSDHPAFEPLKAFSWKAIGPLLRAMESPDPSTQWYSAQLLAERCRFEPHDARLLPAMRRLARSASPELSKIGEQGLYDLAFRVTGGWMGETPVIWELTDIEALGDLIDVLLTGPYQSRDGAKKHLSDFVASVPVEGAPVSGNLTDANVARRFTVDDRYLGHRQPEARMIALASLAASEMVGMPHLEALGDEDENVRQTAVKALKLKFDPAWVPEAAKHLKATNPAVRAAAAKALGWSFQPSAAKLLRKHLGDENPGVRRAAQDAIDRIEGRLIVAPQ